MLLVHLLIFPVKKKKKLMYHFKTVLMLLSLKK